MQKVVIVGLGLVGGSIGLGLKRWSTEQAKNGAEPLQIIGFDTDLEQQNYAKKINAVELDLKDEAGEVGWNPKIPLARQMRSALPISYSMVRMCGWRTPPTMSVRSEAHTLLPLWLFVAMTNTPAGPITR